MSPEAARHLDGEDPEALEEHRAHVKDLHHKKLQFLARIGIDAMAEQLEMSTDEFLTRFAPGSTGERARINWTKLARETQGPTRVGDRARVAANGGQGWVQLLRASGLVNADLLCAQEGDRGYHRCRSANFKVKIGSRNFSVAQKPTAGRVKELFQSEWVETGLVQAGALLLAAWVAVPHEYAHLLPQECPCV